MRQGIGAIALAVAVVAFGTAEAQARVANDPCGDSQKNRIVNQSDGSRLHCAAVSTLAGQDDRYLPYISAYDRCGSGWKLAGTNYRDMQPLTAYWDFWADNGEWLTWTGEGVWLHNDDDPRGYYAAYHMPKVKNWALGDWKARVFHTCDRISAARGEFEPTEFEPGGTGDESPELGGEGADDFGGAEGDDFQSAAEGDDELAGGAGDDHQIAGSGDDSITGGPGDDQVLGGAGDDTAEGGAGGDDLFDDQGRDALAGGGGADDFSAHDGDRDEIDCGSGRDTVVGDRRDEIARDCERVYLTRKQWKRNPPPAD